jgi:predicted aspartyl protease
MSAQPDEPGLSEQLRHAGEYFATGRFDAARVLFEAVLARAPERLDVVLRLAQLALLDNDLVAARRQAEHAVALSPDTPLPYGLLAETCYRVGDYARAAACYRDLGRAGLAAKAERLAGSGAYARTARATADRLALRAHGPLAVVTARVAGQTLNLVVDTAAGELLLDHSVAERGGFGRFDAERIAFAGGRHALVRHAIAPDLELGDARLAPVPCQLLDLAGVFAPFFEFPIHGVLGLDVLRRFHVTLDYPQRALTLATPTAPGAAVTGQRLWFAGSHYPVTVAEAGEGRRVLLLLDTGMAGVDCLVSYSFAQSLPFVAGLEGAITGHGGGGEVRGAALRLPQLCVGGLCRTEVRAAVLERFALERQLGFRLAGLLASDFLRDAVLRLDFTHMTLELTAYA